jgi:His-Xaa-Ser system protein HxsD
MNLTLEQDRARLDVSLRIYPLEAVFGACYSLIDRCYVFLDKPEPYRIAVYLKQRGDEPKPACLEAIAGELSNALLQETMRLKVAKRTGKIREMIVGRALLSAEPLSLPDLAEPENDFDEGAASPADYEEDPLGIAIPWEEKFGGEGNEPEDTGDEA